MENKKNEEEVFDLGNFSGIRIHVFLILDYEDDPQDTCEGDDALKSSKDKSKKQKKKV